MPETSRILILGGYGSTGRRLSRLLVTKCGVEVTIAGRNENRAAILASELGARCRFARVDARDPAGLRHALRMHPLVVLAAPGKELPSLVAQAALECGCDYLDIAYGSEKLRALRLLDERARSEGRCLVTEAGFHPGLPSLLVRWAAQHCEGLRVAEIASVFRFQIEPNVEAPGSLAEFVDQIAESKSSEYVDGQWRELRWWNWPYRPFEFGREWGTLACVPLDFEEVREVAPTCPSLRQLRFVMAGFGHVVDWAVLPAILAARSIGGTSVTEACGKLLWQSLRLFQRAPFGTVLAIRYEGVSDRGLLVLEHRDGYQFTAIAVTAFLKQWLKGTVRRPGLHFMGMLAEPDRLVAHMQRFGVQTRRV